MFIDEQDPGLPVKMQYEELQGEDTITLPDLGTPPKLS